LQALEYHRAINGTFVVTGASAQLEAPALRLQKRARHRFGFYVRATFVLLRH
jgi:hypothetical protein